MKTVSIRHFWVSSKKTFSSSIVSVHVKKYFLCLFFAISRNPSVLVSVAERTTAPKIAGKCLQSTPRWVLGRCWISRNRPRPCDGQNCHCTASLTWNVTRSCPTFTTLDAVTWFRGCLIWCPRPHAHDYWSPWRDWATSMRQIMQCLCPLSNIAGWLKAGLFSGDEEFRDADIPRRKLTRVNL